MSEEANERAQAFAEMTAGLAMQEAFYRSNGEEHYLIKQEMGSVNFLQFLVNSDDIILNNNAVPNHRALYTFICVFDFVTEENIQKLSLQQKRSQNMGVLTDFVIVDIEKGSFNNLSGGRLIDRKLQTVIEKALGYRDIDSESMKKIEREAVIKAKEGRKSAAAVNKLSIKSPVMILILTNIIIFVTGIICQLDTGINWPQQWGVLDSTLIREGQIWRLFTAIFLHADMAHIFGNMYLLLMLGRILNHHYSNSKFLIVYMTSGIFGCFLSFLFSPARSLGASGAIMGLGGVLVCKLLFDQNKAYLRHGMLYANLAFLVLFNLGYGLFNTGIDNYGHFGGFICGFILELIFSRKKA